ncbi:hypothetical protein CYLTODRAFT_488092 [Cylindrobasidium torrendii FP15055 ss-10]|uniref:Mif2/CENP-C cupin domain-containing protein n=1 Tax=Cylindrobasidium torrendii FP15055 ss-10 TaxID=1314674 RepID=A0A0D7BIY1_9AGAR|nr:hypothetical protein CYLTODRAFT_488092 [Cylindrobasidium torrendii FP15055 ss-10]
MPTTPRRSSTGSAFRRNEKPYKPYRGDQLAVGKRTGVLIRPVERHSDGFEDFDEVMLQKDPRTPPNKRKKIRKTPAKSRAPSLAPDEPSDGEVSMELDQTPIHYQTTAKADISRRTAASTSRSVARVDYDKLPSPRGPNSRSSRNARPSRLSEAIAAGTFFDDDEDMDEPSRNDGADDPFDDDQLSFNDSFPEHRSFQELDQDEEEEETHNQEEDLLPPDSDDQITPPKSKGKDKGKGSARTHEPEPEPEYEMEDQIANDLTNVDTQFDEEEEQPEETPRPKKQKEKKAAEPKPKVKIIPVSKKENRDVPPGVRRSGRLHIKPLEWWRGERVVYGRPDPDAKVFTAPILEYRREPKPELPPLGKKKTTRKRKRPSQIDAPEVEAEAILNPEAGWDDETEVHADVKVWPTDEIEEMQVAFTANMIDPTAPKGQEWLYARLFGEGNKLAAGKLVIPVGKRKQTKSTNDNTFIFYLIEGAINLRVHQKAMLLCQGSAFIVPRGNTYSLENVAERDSKLFFVQARAAEGDARRQSRTVSVDQDEGEVEAAPKKRKARTSKG